MKGHIEFLKERYGFIVGEDRRSYFFIPTHMQMTSLVSWEDLQRGMQVEFTPIEGERGPRALEIRVTERRAAAHGHQNT